VRRRGCMGCKQQAHDCMVPAASGNKQRCHTLLARSIHIRPCCHERMGNSRVTKLASYVQSCNSVVSGKACTGTRGQQCLHNSHVSFLRSHLQWCTSISLGEVNTGTRTEQQLYQIKAAFA
jgi:hypothetical protein